MKVLEHGDEWLHLALAEEKALDRVQRSLPPLWRIEARPLLVLDGHVEECEQRRQCRLQCAVQRKQLARDFLADLAQVVAGLDLKIAAQQLDDQEIRRRLAIRGASSFDHKATFRAMRTRELPEQTRFADTGLAHDRDDLAVTVSGEVERLRESSNLTRPSDKLREPARDVRVEARARWIPADQLVDVNRL